MRTELTLRDLFSEPPPPAAADLALLDEVQIASPCAANWDDMKGDARARHCGSCDRMVYDLSGLTAAEAAALIRAKEGSFCVRLFRRADGRILTADCPNGLRDRLAKTWRQPGLTLGMKLGLVLLLAVSGLFCWLADAFLLKPHVTMGAYVHPGDVKAAK